MMIPFSSTLNSILKDRFCINVFIIISDGRTVSLYDKQGKLENEIRISPFDSISFGTSNYLSDFSSQEVIFSCPGSDTLYFLGKSGITRKISLDYGHNQSPEQFKKSLSKPITFPYFHNFISLGKTVLDLIVIGQKQYMIQLDLTHRTATVCDTLSTISITRFPTFPGRWYKIKV